MIFSLGVFLIHQQEGHPTLIPGLSRCPQSEALSHPLPPGHQEFYWNPILCPHCGRKRGNGERRSPRQTPESLPPPTGLGHRAPAPCTEGRLCEIPEGSKEEAGSRQRRTGTATSSPDQSFSLRPPEPCGPSLLHSGAPWPPVTGVTSRSGLCAVLGLGHTDLVPVPEHSSCEPAAPLMSIPLLFHVLVCTPFGLRI